MRSSRLLSLLMLLQTRRQMTAGELARELEVSLRTIYRDVEALSAAGVPVYAEQGRAGGYRLVDGYRTQLTGLTGPEAAAMFLVGVGDAATALGMTEQASAAELKLLAALSPAQRAGAVRVRDRFHLDVPSWYHQAAVEPHLAALAEAVLHDRVVDVVYRRWAEPREVERTLEPHGVVLKSGVWYVVARAATAPATTGTGTGTAGDVPQAPSTFRVYRVSNILRLTPTDQNFARQSSFDLAKHWKAHLSAFDERRFRGVATVRLSARLVDRLPDISSTHLAQTVASAGGTADTDGSMTVALPIESVELAARELIAHGPDLEVLEPADLRAEIAGLAARVAQLYAESCAATLVAS